MFGYKTYFSGFGTFLAGLLLIHLSNCQHAVITPQGTQIKTVESGIIFTCTIVEYSPLEGKPDIRWIGPDDKDITDTIGRVYIERYDTLMMRLYITKISEEDAGRYTCHSTIDGQPLEDSTKIVIFEEIQFDEGPSIVQEEIGSNPFLPCSATGQPEPEVSWRFNRAKLSSKSEKYDYQEGGLRIFHLSMRDAGFYECRAEVTSQGNVKVKTVQMDVLYAPSVTRPPLDANVIQGHNATLICMAHGNPDVTFEWYREQKMSGVVKVKVKLAEGVDTYVIIDVQKEDEGRYFCKVSNTLGNKEVYADVKMLVPPTIDELPHKVLSEGRAMLMTCEAKGVPEPEITWLRQGELDEYINGVQPDDPRIDIDNAQVGHSKLIIHDAQRSYSGVYTCIARNSVGEFRANGTVTVEFKPTLNTSETDKLGWQGQSRNFTCAGYGLPLPTMNWFRDGHYISHNVDTYDIQTETAEVVTSTLTIHIDRQPWIYGMYNCIAKNQYGYVAKAFHLRKALPPDMPRNVSVLDETPSTVVLFAAKPVPRKRDELPMTSWMVKFERAGPGHNYYGGEKTLRFSIDETVTVDGLRPDTPYNFYLSAGNEVGYGKAIKFRVRTPRREPKEKAPADVPRKSEKDEKNATYTILEEENEARRKEEMKGKTVKEEAAAEPSTEGGGSLGLVTAVCIGLGVFLIIIILGAICIRRRSRRNNFPQLNKNLKKQNGTGGSIPMVMVSGGRDVDNIQLEIRRGESELPDVVNQDSARTPGEVRRNGKITMSSPVPGRAGVEVPATALTVNNPNTIQKRAWDHMLMHQAIHSDEEEEIENQNQHSMEDELSPIMDLPPPPPFLLENENEGPHGAQGSSYAHILDGYHSEDPVDDDIDNDYGIRQPSYHQEEAYNIRHNQHNNYRQQQNYQAQQYQPKANANPPQHYHQNS